MTPQEQYIEKQKELIAFLDDCNFSYKVTKAQWKKRKQLYDDLAVIERLLIKEKPENKNRTLERDFAVIYENYIKEIHPDHKEFLIPILHKLYSKLYCSISFPEQKEGLLDINTPFFGNTGAKILEKKLVPEKVFTKDEISLRDKILEESKKGNVIVSTFDGLQITSLKDIVEQPIDGLLYDLNRDIATILTFIDDPKWINDFACASVISELKRRLLP